jgi:hypothetical protein
MIYGLLMALGLFVAGAIGAITVTTFNIIDYIGVATAPSNPTSGKGRLYFSTADSQLHCLTHSGGSCLSGGGGGGVCPSGAANDVQFTDGTNCASDDSFFYDITADIPILHVPLISTAGITVPSISSTSGITIQTAHGANLTLTAPVGGNINIGNASELVQIIGNTLTETVGDASAVTPGSVIQRVVAGTTDTILNTDRNNRVAYNSATAVAVSLPTAGSAGFAGGFNTRLSNQNTGTVTVTPATGTINGNATLVMLEGQFCFLSPSAAGTSYAADCGEPQTTAGTGIVLTRGVHTLTVSTSSVGAFTTLSATGVVTLSQAAASGAAGINITGAIFSGNGTTSLPTVYINQAVTQPTTWNTSGTALGINVATGTGRAIDIHTNGGASIFAVDSSGGMSSAGITSSGGITAAAGSNLGLNGRTQFRSSADGIISFNNNANGAGGQTQVVLGLIGNTTNPEFNISGLNIDIRRGNGTTGGGSLSINGGSQIKGELSGTATLDFANQAAIGCNDLTITVTGAAVGDTVAIGVPNGSVPNGTAFFTGWVSATDTVTTRYCNLVSGDPASGTFRATVTQF